MTPAEFIARWEGSGGAELANSQSFLKELCELLDLPQPEPTHADESQNTYVFEKAVEFNNGDGTTSSGRVDLYRRGCFVLESKQLLRHIWLEPLALDPAKQRAKIHASWWPNWPNSPNGWKEIGTCGHRTSFAGCGGPIPRVALHVPLGVPFSYYKR